MALAVSGGSSFVTVVQSADLRHRHDWPHSRRLNRAWLRGVFPQGQDVFWIGGSSQNTKRGFGVVSFHGTRSHGRDTHAEWSQSPAPHRLAAKAIAAQTAPPAMPMSRTCSPELIAEDPIAVPQQVARESVKGKCFPQLLPRPLCGRVGGHIEVQDAATIMGQHQKHVKDLETNRGHREEIDGDELQTWFSRNVRQV